LSEPSAPPPFWPASWIGPDAPPLTLDIGCHRGYFLEAMATAHPGRNFLGIERLSERVLRTRNRLQRAQLTNAEVVSFDGAEAVASLPKQSIDEIHVLFPDPWPKRRHSGRRLVNAAFIVACTRILKAGSLLRIVTDHHDYARQIELTLSAQTTLELTHEHLEFPPTAFQMRFEAQEKKVNNFALRKRAF